MAVTSNGRVLASHAIPYPTHYPKPGYAEQHPNQILEAVKTCIKQTLKGAHGEKLLGLSFSAAMHSLMAIDKNGVPISPLIIWSDLRSTEFANDLFHRRVAFKIYAATGTAIHPMSPLCKLMWWKANRPDLIKNAFRFLSIKDYVLHHFTGQCVTDYSIASASGLFNIHSLQWNSDSLHEAGITVDQLPEAIPTTHVITGIKEDISRELSLPLDVKIVPGASDGCLANLGTNATNAGELSLTIGTSGAVRMIVNELKTDQEQRIFNYILSKNRFVVGGATNNGAVLLQWFEKNLGESEKGNAIYTDLELACQQKPNDLIFLPYLLGERAPIYDPLARGVFFGVSLQHQRLDLLRGVVEGICFSLLSIADSLKDVVGEYKIVVASGGFIRSPGWVQLLADVFGKEVKIVAQEDASAIGAARLGFEALGLSETFFEKEDAEVVYRPDMKLHDLYQKKFQIFLSLYRNLKQDFYNLSKLGETIHHD